MKAPELMFGDDLTPDHDLVVCVSGGKDSTALALWLEFESLLENKRFYVWSDTGHEHPETIKHVDMLEAKLGKHIHRIRGPYTFLSLAKSKQRFPSSRARFCTTELKVNPTIEFIAELIGTGDIEKPCVTLGIRRDESASRSTLPVWGFDRTDGGRSRNAYEDVEADVWRPLIHWDADDVFNCHRRHDMPFNPLYLKGARRVGCWPCIHSTKAELRAAHEVDPEMFDRLAAMEAEVAAVCTNRTTAAFFAPNKTPVDFHDVKVKMPDGTVQSFASAEGVKKWALGDEDQGRLFKEPPGGCWSQYGLCE